MSSTMELLKRSWESEPDSPTMVNMRNAPKGWRIWVYADIDVSFVGDYDENISEEDDRETEESKAKDRTRPWIIRASQRYAAVTIGPRFERITGAMRWAEDFAEDIDIAAGRIPMSLGRTSGEA